MVEKCIVRYAAADTSDTPMGWRDVKDFTFCGRSESLIEEARALATKIGMTVYLLSGGDTGGSYLATEDNVDMEIALWGGEVIWNTTTGWTAAREV